VEGGGDDAIDQRDSPHTVVHAVVHPAPSRPPRRPGRAVRAGFSTDPTALSPAVRTARPRAFRRRGDAAAPGARGGGVGLC